MTSLRLSLLPVASVCLLLSACAGSPSGGTGTAGSSGGGTAGTTGAAGTGSATAGTTGSAGTTGAAGTTGNAGTGGSVSGVAGSGVAGTGGAGTAGTTGSAGTGGTSGAAGASGGRGGTGGSSAGTGGTGGSAGRGGQGGSAGAGGRGGAAGAGGGTGGAATGCPAGAVFCDDFEAGTVGQAPNATQWTLSLNSNGTIQIDSAQAHGGTKSMHINGMSGFHTMAMARGAPLFPLPAGVLYGRTWLRLGTAPGNNHLTWIEAGSITNDQAETRIGYNIGAMDINRYPGDTEQRAPTATLQTGMWYCIEFMFDSSADEARVWLGGTEVTDLHVTNWVAPNPQNGNNTTAIPNWAPDYQAVRFGWELNGGSIWFDDIVLGYSRINCQ